MERNLACYDFVVDRFERAACRCLNEVIKDEERSCSKCKKPSVLNARCAKSRLSFCFTHNCEIVANLPFAVFKIG